MDATLVTVRLSGRWGMPEVERELARGPVALDLPAGATGQQLLERLAHRCGERFRRRALKADGTLRAEVRLFVQNEMVANPAAPIGDKLVGGAEVSVVLLRPLVGG